MNLKKICTSLAILAASATLTTNIFAASTDVKPAELYELTDSQKSYVMQYYQIALEESVGHNVPWQIAMAQGILESGCGTTSNARENHNHHGITDGKGGYKYFATDEEGWEGYFENIDKTKVYDKNGVHEAVNPLDYIDALIASGYAEDPLYRDKIVKLYESIEAYRLQLGLFSTEEYAEYLEESALAAWPAKEQKLVSNELCRLYHSEVTRRLTENEVTNGRAGITNVQAIMLSEVYNNFIKSHETDLASIVSREDRDVG